MPNYKRYYLENHYIFITVLTHHRQSILIENVDLLRECFKKTLKTFNFEILASVILPNHFHIIIKPENIKEFPKIVGLIKKYFSYSINEKYKGTSKNTRRN
ncbi:MAG: transposase [bacterium]